MIIEMEKGASEEAIQRVIERVKKERSKFAFIFIYIE